MNIGEERGSASVLTLVLSVVIMCLGVIAIAFVQISVTRAALGSYADLAAIAAAQAPGNYCVEAARIAALNGVQLEACGAVGTAVRVRVSTPSPQLIALLSGSERLSVVAQATRGGQVAN